MTYSSPSNKKLSVWLIAGTTEGRQIAGALCEQGIEVLATVTTSAGHRVLTQSCPAARVEVGLFDSEAMGELIARENVGLVVDATHPYAGMASRNAIAACACMNVPYLRYERPRAAAADYSLLMSAPDFESAAQLAVAFGSTVFLTVGSRELEPFVNQARIAGVKLVARILDDPISRKIAKQAGLTDSELVYFRGVFDDEWISGHLSDAGASVMVCKDSGHIGGTVKKIEACREISVPVVVIDRPQIDYPLALSDTGEVIARASAWAKGGHPWVS